MSERFSKMGFSEKYEVNTLIIHILYLRMAVNEHRSRPLSQFLIMSNCFSMCNINDVGCTFDYSIYHAIIICEQASKRWSWCENEAVFVFCIGRRRRRLCVYSTCTCTHSRQTKYYVECKVFVCLHKMKCFRNKNNNNGVISQHIDKWNWTKYSPHANKTATTHMNWSDAYAKKWIVTASNRLTDWLTESKQMGEWVRGWRKVDATTIMVEFKSNQNAYIANTHVKRNHPQSCMFRIKTKTNTINRFICYCTHKKRKGREIARNCLKLLCFEYWENILKQ